MLWAQLQLPEKEKKNEKLKTKNERKRRTVLRMATSGNQGSARGRRCRRRQRLQNIFHCT